MLQESICHFKKKNSPRLSFRRKFEARSSRVLAASGKSKRKKREMNRVFIDIVCGKKHVATRHHQWFLHPHGHLIRLRLALGCT